MTEQQPHWPQAERNRCTQHLTERSAAANGNAAPRNGATAALRSGHADCLRDGVSDAEIVQLVSVALEGALLAFGEKDPKDFLERRAVEGRGAMHRIMASLPHLQANDATVLTEYQRAFVFQDAVARLALEITHAVARYARAPGAEASPDAV